MVTNQESATHVEAFHPNNAMLGALCVFWMVAAEALPLDIGTLQQRDANFHCPRNTLEHPISF